MKNRIYRLSVRAIVIFALSLITIASCKKDPVLNASVSEISFPKSGKTVSVDIVSDQEWSITAPEWITCNPASGSGSATVKFKAGQNNGVDREGTINIISSAVSASINAVQVGVDFSIDTYAIDFGTSSSPRQMVISSKYSWNIEIPSEGSWCEVSPTSGGAGETVVTLTPKPYTDRTPRHESFLTVNYNGTFSMVSIKQDLPNSAPEVPVLVSPAEGETDVAIIHEFKWRAPKDPDGDVLTYNLKISKDGGVKWSTTETVSTSSKASVYLDKNTEYLWKVEAMDPFGGVSSSDPVRFTTGTKGAHADGEVRLYKEESAGAPKPIHLIFMGDGFIEEDYLDGGAFDKAVETAVNALFGLEPYTTYEDYFRISTVAVYSQERGATVKADMKNCKAMNRNTAFAAELEGGNSTGTSCNFDKVFSYALKVKGVDQDALQNTTVFLLINLDVYAGTCMMEANGRSISMCPMGSDSFEKVVCHEGGGHGFGRLLDEYRYTKENLPVDMQQSVQAWREMDPYFGNNISLTNDRSKVHWKHFFELSGYNAVGLYEGGYLYYYGVWRPEYISCMEDNRYYYNAPSREAIVRRIMKASGSAFDINAFVANDKYKSDPTGSANAPRTNYVEEELPPLAPPIMIYR